MPDVIPYTTPGVPVLPADAHAGYNKRRLFLVSVIALATTGIAFSIRGNIGRVLGQQFFSKLDKDHSASLVSQVLGVEFLGFAITIAIGKLHARFPRHGKRLLGLSSFCMVVGTAERDFHRQAPAVGLSLLGTLGEHSGFSGSAMAWWKR